MITTLAFDVEIFPNMFSVTFVDLADYLNTFKDVKGALTDNYSVKEIKEKLATVKSKIFYISDTDDSQLIHLVSYFGNMRVREAINQFGEPELFRTDFYGFNSIGYDDLMIAEFMMRWNTFTRCKDLIKHLYNFSKKIISLQGDNEAFYKDPEIELCKQYVLPYFSIDVQRVYGLNSAGVIVDKDTGERIKYGKSLKQTSINLKWHELLDFTLPPIDEEEYNIYWKDITSMSITQLNKVTNDFDRYVLPKYVEGMLYYNLNDVYLVCEMVRQKPDEIRLRYSITKAFKINVLSSARANIADKLTVKFYSDMSGLRKDEFIKGRTEHSILNFSKIIFPHISYKTKQLQDFLADVKKVKIRHTSKSEFSRELTFYGTTYTIATGGIHSVDKPGIFKSDDKYLYLHHDYTSYYPSIMISYNLFPAHLNKVFVKMLSNLKDTRVKAKHTKDEDGLVISDVPNGITAEALKIVINAIYGKLGSELFFLYDRFVQMQVTINGQLMTLSLIEELELNGIHVISANTDGIILKLPRDKFEQYQHITEAWNETNKMGADYEAYKLLVCRDINNYFNIQESKKGDKFEFKGDLDPKQYCKDYKKGYDMPIVAQAAFEYFAFGRPVLDTLYNATNILDFCKTQNVGKKFSVVYHRVVDGNVEQVETQRHCRFYVSTKGVALYKKEDLTDKLSSLASGCKVKILNSLDDKPIEERNIDYTYYYNEVYKIINPIQMRISPNQKSNPIKGTKSGKALIKKYGNGALLNLFDDDSSGNVEN
ncbi:MAG: hypothetical protein MJ209_00315 [archaeon]|nr:hypothetical protein [archaeon]